MSLSASKPIHPPGVRPAWCPRSSTRATATLESVEYLLKTTCPPDELAAIFVEPIQGEGGYIVPPDGFLSGLRRICDRPRDLAGHRRDPGGHRPHRAVLRQRALGRGRRHRVPGQGARQRPAAGGRSWPPADVMDWPPGSHASTFGGKPGGLRRRQRDDRPGRVAVQEECRGTRRRTSRRPAAAGIGIPVPCATSGGLGADGGAGSRLRGGGPDPDLRDAIIDRAFYRGLLLLPCGPSTVRFCPSLVPFAPTGFNGTGNPGRRPARGERIVPNPGR